MSKFIGIIDEIELGGSRLAEVRFAGGDHGEDSVLADNDQIESIMAKEFGSLENAIGKTVCVETDRFGLLQRLKWQPTADELRAELTAAKEARTRGAPPDAATIERLRLAVLDRHLGEL